MAHDLTMLGYTLPTDDVDVLAPDDAPQEQLIAGVDLRRMAISGGMAGPLEAALEKAAGLVALRSGLRAMPNSG